MKRDFHKLLVEETPDALIATSVEGEVLYWNHGAEAIFDYSSEEAVGQPMVGLIVPSDRLEEAKAVRQALHESGAVTYELLRQKKDGTLIYLNASIRLTRDAEGQPEYIIVNIKDVTSLKAMRDARLVEARYRDLLDSIPDPIIIVNNTGRIVLTNSQAEGLFGYPAAELLGQPIELLLPERFRLVHRKHRNHYFAQPQARPMGENLELYALHRNGHELPIEVNLSPFAIDNGTLVMSTIRDISERKRHELTYALLASIVESSQDAIYSETLDSIVTSWNKGAEKIFGYSAAEVIGRPISLLIPPESNGEEAHLLSRIRNGEQLASYETVRLRKDGQRIDISLSLSPIKDAAGKIIGASKIARDITERKWLEHVLQEKNVLEQANQIKDRFLASMSHELRTPLNAIVGFTGTLLMQLPGPLTADQNRQLRTVQDSARHLLKLINDLLNLASVEAGRTELKWESVICQSVVEEVASALRPLAAGKGLKFEVSFPPGEVVVQSDRGALSQILLNFAYNSVKFTEKGSIRLELDQRMENDWLLTEISVIDTGIGIQVQDQATLFHTFVQPDPASRRPDEGMGLGLYLSQKLAELLGGQISFQSEPGWGSRFTLTLANSLEMAGNNAPIEAQEARREDSQDR